MRSPGGGATIACMNVSLTGATGFIGSHVLTELQGHGHDVTALVRDEAKAAAVAARGAPAAVVELYDRPAGAAPARVGRLSAAPPIARLLRAREVAIHTASPGDAPSADLDAAVAD